MNFLYVSPSIGREIQESLQTLVARVHDLLLLQDSSSDSWRTKSKQIEERLKKKKNNYYTFPESLEGEITTKTNKHNGSEEDEKNSLGLSLEFQKQKREGRNG